MGLFDRVKYGWNAFMNKDPTLYRKNLGYNSYARPDRVTLTRGNERSIITSIYNRLSLDAALCEITHVRLDKNDSYLETIDSGLNQCLTLSANIDQTGRAMIQDAIISMFDEGCIAIVPIDTSVDPNDNDAIEIHSLRVCKIVEWYPMHVKVRAYDERCGKYAEIVVPKKSTTIVENPFYSVMNMPNSTMQRLIRKLNILDAIDEQSSAGKLDLIIQLPYVIKTEERRRQAEERRQLIEQQLAGSKYGIAYTDGTEHITQLNRSVDNNLMSQIEFLTSMLYSQLGLTPEIMNGTADEKVMNNYYSRTIEPILCAIVDEMKRKFLTKTARTQKQSIRFFRDPFKLVPVTEIAEMSDKLTRNEILTSNEFRQIIGRRPADDPNANALRNKNLSASPDMTQLDLDGNVIKEGTEQNTKKEESNQNETTEV